MCTLIYLHFQNFDLCFEFLLLISFLKIDVYFVFHQMLYLFLGRNEFSVWKSLLFVAYPFQVSLYIITWSFDYLLCTRKWFLTLFWFLHNGKSQWTMFMVSSCCIHFLTKLFCFYFRFTGIFSTWEKSYCYWCKQTCWTRIFELFRSDVFFYCFRVI